MTNQAVEPNKRQFSLDGLRGIAALVVVMHHLLLTLPSFTRIKNIICINSANPKRILKANQGSKVFFRKNRGRDLGILRDFMRITPDKLEKPILFINSSCYWDYEILNEKVTELMHVEDEIIFGTVSLQHSLHAQTFLIWVPAICVEQFKSIFASKKMIRNWHTKRSTVYFGEKRLLRWLFASNLKVSVLYHPEEFIKKSERGKKIYLSILLKN